jgi:flagellar hook-associated protein 3 FlgL
MSWQTIYNNVTGAIAQQMQSLAQLQEQVSTGKRVNTASDDPVAADQIMSLHSESESLTTYASNISSVLTNMQQTSSSLTDIDNALVQAKQLLTQASTATSSSTDDQAIGQELNSLLEQVVSSANTQNDNQYLFGGSKSSAPPYTVQRDSSGTITSVTYTGSDQPLNVSVAPGVQQSGVLVGDNVFRCDSPGTPVFLGDTGAKAGAGTSSVQGAVWLSVTHDQTQYAGGTGVAAGADSATGDTIVGDGHTLHIDADQKTVSLDDGTAVSYTGASNDLQLTNSNGDTVYVDMTGLHAGLTGTTDVSIQATAKLSIDDGASTVESTSGQQAVTDSATGKILYVDTSSLARTGTEPISVPGTYNMFDMLINARDVLLGKRPVSQSSFSSVINQSLDSLNDVYSGVVTQASGVGAREQAMTTLQSSLTTMQSNNQTQTSGLQDADITQLSVELSKVQNYYELTLSSAAKVLSLSLLDYLQ